MQKTLYSRDEAAVGGIVGLTHYSTDIKDCNISDISVTGAGANLGGVIGALHHNKTEFTVAIDNVVLDGTNSVNGISNVYRMNIGGLIAKSTNAKINISNTQVKNYTFARTENNDSNHIGGAIGYNASDKLVTVNNLLISDCIFTDATSDVSGGLIPILLTVVQRLLLMFISNMVVRRAELRSSPVELLLMK